MESRNASGSSDPVRVEAILERKHASLPRFVVVPDEAVASWGLEGTTIVEAALDDVSIGRRSLKRWSERGGWFFDLTRDQAETAGVDVGDEVLVELRLPSTALPSELQTLLDSNPRARAVWESLTDARRRMLAEHVRGAKRSETRRRRAEKALER